MRVLLVFPALVASAAASIPAVLEEALGQFRSDPPRGWSYTQTTVAGGRSTVERCDASKPEFERWSLVQKDGRAPTDAEQKTYAEMRSRRSRGGTAPKLTEQLDLGSIELVHETSDRITYHGRLKPGERSDRTAPFLRATIVVHTPTRTIASLELDSTGEFTPSLGVRIAVLQTLMTYAPPAGDLPAFPRRVTTLVRGRAFWFKSLDADMTVTYSDYEKPVFKKRST
jgi:hypothetical protein